MEVKHGLKGVTAVETGISQIDGEKGILHYRTTSLTDCSNHSFEEVAMYIWDGTWHGSERLKKRFLDKRDIDHSIIETINELSSKQSLIATIRSAVSMIDQAEDEWPISIDTAARLTSVLPVIVAIAYRAKKGRSLIEPRNDLSHVGNLLYMVQGKVPSDTQVDALESYMIATMEHGLNASTFASRVVLSTRSDAYSAAIAAIGALKGPLHGGAPSGVIDYLNEVNQTSVKEVIDRKLSNNEKIMGFGHRVYKTTDPRAIALKEQLMKMKPRPDWVNQAIEIEHKTVQYLNEQKPGRKLYANVEFYAAALMKAIELPSELFTPIFCCSRMVGWTAHMREQSLNNVIFRPKAKYTEVQ